MQRTLTLLLLASALGACVPRLRLNFTAGPNLNTEERRPGQPVQVGVYQLASPVDVFDSVCTDFEFPLDVDALVAASQKGKARLTSVLPGEAGQELELRRQPGAWWLLVVPFYEAACTAPDVDGWLLMRMPPWRKYFYVELNRYAVQLPWGDSGDSPAERQRGCIEGEGSHTAWPRCP